MRSLLAGMVVVVVLAASSPGFAEQWSASPWQVTPDGTQAFDVAFHVLNDGLPVDDVWYYYRWDVTLLLPGDGSYFQCTDGTTTYDMTAIRGFAFKTPSADGNHMVDGGSFIEKTPGVLTPLDWKFLPQKLNQDWDVGFWTGNSGNSETIPAGTPGHFRAGLWSTGQFQMNEQYDVQIHVNTINPTNTGFVGWEAPLTPIPDEPGPEPPVTPELPSGALLLLGMLPAGLVAWRRRSRIE